MSNVDVNCVKCEGRGITPDNQMCVCVRRNILNSSLPENMRDVPIDSRFVELLKQEKVLNKVLSHDVYALNMSLEEYHSTLKGFIAFNLFCKSTYNYTFQNITPLQLADIKYARKKFENLPVDMDDLYKSDMISVRLVISPPNETYEALLMNLLTTRYQSGLRTWVWKDPLNKDTVKQFGDLFMAYLEDADVFMKITKGTYK